MDNALVRIAKEYLTAVEAKETARRLAVEAKEAAHTCAEEAEGAWSAALKAEGFDVDEWELWSHARLVIAGSAPDLLTQASLAALLEEERV